MSTSSQMADLLANALLNAPAGLRTQDLMDIAGVKVSREECIHMLSADAIVVKTGKGPGLRWFHVNHKRNLDSEEVEKADLHRRRARLEAARQTIINLARESESIRTVDVRAATDLSGDTVRHLLDQLVSDRVLERRGHDKNITYRLAAK